MVEENGMERSGSIIRAKIEVEENKTIRLGQGNVNPLLDFF